MKKRTAPGLQGFVRLSLLLALIAVGLKVLVPGGYMLAPPDAASPFPVVICSPDIGDSSLPDDGRPSSGHDKPCAFAFANVTAAEPVQTLAPAVPVSSDEVRRDAFEIAPGRGLAAPPPPARGPPPQLI